MGFYINPKGGTSKEQWLWEYGVPMDAPTNAGDFKSNDNTLPVCLVDNGAFTAAGIGFDAQEMMAFARPDSRPKVWFRVPVEKLLEVCPGLEIMLDR